MVGDLDVNGDFVLLGAEGSGGETSAIDPLDAGDGGLDQEASAVSVRRCQAIRPRAAISAA